MRRSATKSKILEIEQQKLATQPEAIIYMQAETVELYSAGALTKAKLKELRRLRQGPHYIRAADRTIIYKRKDVDDYLAGHKVEHSNRDILHALQQMTEHEKAAARDKVIEFLFGDSGAALAIVKSTAAQPNSTENSQD